MAREISHLEIQTAAPRPLRFPLTHAVAPELLDQVTRVQESKRRFVWPPSSTREPVELSQIQFGNSGVEAWYDDAGVIFAQLGNGDEDPLVRLTLSPNRKNVLYIDDVITNSTVSAETLKTLASAGVITTTLVDAVLSPPSPESKQKISPGKKTGS
jgi:hypothetical protein